MKHIFFLISSILMCFSPASLSQAQESIETISVAGTSSSRALYQSLTPDTLNVTPDDFATSKRSAADLVALSSGMSLNGQGGLFQSYNIRGFSKSRIVTEVDGIPIITDRRAGNSASFIPGALISNVYLQKGPSAMLYGSDAMGGVVALSTEIDKSSLSMNYQNIDSASEWLGQYSGDNVSGALLHRQATNSESPNNDQLNSQYRQMFGKLASEFEWNDLVIKATSSINRGRNIGKSSAIYPAQKISLYPKDNHWLSAVELSDRQQWKLKMYHHNQDWESDVARIKNDELSRRNITQYKAATIGSYGSFVADNTTFGAQWLGRKNIHIVDNEYNNIGQLQWSKETVNAKQDTFAVYAHHLWKLQQWQIKAGARFDEISVTNKPVNGVSQHTSDNFLSLSIDGQYQIDDATLLTMQIASAFRFPSVSELFFSGETPRGNTQGNSNLRPENSVGYQLSLNHQITDRISVLVNSYYYNIDDYIERYRLADGSRSYRNTVQVTSIGGELIVSLDISKNISSQIGLQYQNNEDRQHHAVDDALPTALKWQLYWQNGPWSIKSQLNYQWRQADIGPSEQARDAVLIENLSVDYALNQNMLISAAIVNLTNATYKASADEDAAYQPKRSLNLSWRWSF